MARQMIREIGVVEPNEDVQHMLAEHREREHDKLAEQLGVALAGAFRSDDIGARALVQNLRHARLMVVAGLCAGYRDGNREGARRQPRRNAK